MALPSTAMQMYFDCGSISMSCDSSRMGDAFFMRQVKLMIDFFSDEPILMTLSDTMQMDKHIQDDWKNWVSNAPDHWKRDGFLNHRIPISVACRYGQNQPLDI